MSKDMQDPMQANVEFSSNMFEPSKVMQDLFYLQSLSAMHISILDKAKNNR